ncbi:putative ATP-dependent RNA helicase [Saccharomycopsis crataegensis]|uniref:ATP-dependent RNA helicase n=1 Tax=Saccharomycopsis crataegensis TaxID=43959 RepID=A0AAV5QHK9_9ASCO|nr:putative ATP-dependent RNA helicase [Saccharomycopsis crataegensis]
MSEDDGLLLNFSTEPAVVSNAPQNRTAKEGPRKKKNPEKKKLTTSYSRPISKRRLLEEGQEDTPESKRARNDAIDKNTFVSSLFSSNGESSTNKNNSNSVQLDPSNAPLTGSGVTFASLGIDEKLSGYLEEKLNFKTPTKIQRLVIPTLLKAQQDLFIQAQTGSGKTLSFSLPIFNTLMSLSTPVSRESGLFAIILAPSRELALQIYSVLEQLNKRYVKIVPGIVIGGEKKKSEKARLRKGVNILVSTPGRLLDHLNSTKNLHENLSLVRWLILDEGDKLMELGFEETLTNIIKIIESATGSKLTHTNREYPELPRRRINVLCSATIKSNVKKLGEISLNNPQLITSGKETNPGNVVEFPDESNATVPDQLTQDILVVPPKLRLVSLAGVLKNITNVKTSGSRTIVFLSCADSVDFHFDVFTRDGKALLSSKGGARRFVKSRFRAPKPTPSEDKDDKKKEAKKPLPPTEPSEVDMVDSAMSAPTLNPNTTIYKLHGMLPQHIRTATLQHFTKSDTSDNQHSILFCTDVASRGLDLPLISTVIEYDPSFALDDHLHRVGRTARAGKAGRSVLFLLPGDEENYIKRLESHHTSGFNILNYEKVLKESFEDEEKKKKWDVEATTWHLNVERWLLEDQSCLAKAEQAFSSHIRAYATHLSSERDCFNLRSLHLGHLAKSFGLRETPKKLGRKYGNGKGKGKSGSEEPKKQKMEDPKKKMLRMAAMAVKSQSSEFNFM